MTLSPLLAQYLATSGWGDCTPPEPLVGAEHFVGTAPEEHIFSFYGETFRLPSSIDWEHNPGTAHWGHDLNRFGFLILLDRARSGSVDKLAALIQDWIAKHGETSATPSRYAWGNLLNITIRLENWLRFVSQTRGVLTWDELNWRRFNSCAREHVRVALRQLRARGFGDNWSLLALRALMFALLSNRAFPHRAALLRICEGYAGQAVKQQILPDGVQQELSPHYHWVAAELIHSIVEMSAACGRQVGMLAEAAAPMADFLDALMTPGGRLVSLGDSDADYGPRIGAFLARARSPWCEPDFHVRVFEHAGVVSVRDRQTNSLLVFDSGPFGTGHQHEDKLGFWLSVGEDDIIVDPGRYLYEPGEESFYAYLRSTHAHSTVTIDGQGQNARASPGAWRAETPIALVERTGASVEVFGEYRLGYGPQRIDVRHSRRIICISGRREWRIIDRIAGVERHLIESRLQLHPCAHRLSGGVLEARFKSVRARIEFDSSVWRARVAEGEMTPKSGWWSPGLNRIAPAPMLILTAEAQLPFETEMRIIVN